MKSRCNKALMPLFVLALDTCITTPPANTAGQAVS
jgi:hypothetical protein